MIDEHFRVQIKRQKCYALGPAVSRDRCESREAAKTLACMQWDKRASEQVAASVAVPEVATASMVEAAAKFAHDKDSPATKFYRGLWATMLAAAPVAPATGIDSAR